MSLPVSVIVPIFNQGDYALRAIDSLCAQTYDNLQIIVVDDGSSDGSAKRVRQHFGAKITLLEQENAGPSAALNAGLRIAQGDIIALMGGDDIATQDRITHQAAILGTANWDVVFSKPQLINETGAPIRDGLYPVFPAPANQLTAQPVFDDNYLCAPSATMRRSVIDAVGPFHEGLIQLQDYDYWLRAAGQGYRLGLFDHRIVAYRRHTGNLSAATRTWPHAPKFPSSWKAYCRRRGPAFCDRPSRVHATGRRSRGSVEPVRTKRGIARPPKAGSQDAWPDEGHRLCQDTQGAAAGTKPHLFRYIYNAGNAIR